MKYLSQWLPKRLRTQASACFRQELNELYRQPHLVLLVRHPCIGALLRIEYLLQLDLEVVVGHLT